MEIKVRAKSEGAGAAVATTFRHADLTVTIAAPNQRKSKPTTKELVFGRYFTDHMLEIEWSSRSGWKRPFIKPFHYLRIHPAAKVLHYANEVFEGFKAYRGEDGKIRLFRPDLNMTRMNRSAVRACLPTFDGDELLKCIADLVRLDHEWVPNCCDGSLYIRPTFIGTEPYLDVCWSEEALLYVLISPCNSYFKERRPCEPISLMANPSMVRVAPGGAGAFKLGANYGPTVLGTRDAQRSGCQQVLWLYGDDERLTEFGAMNLIILWKNKKTGARELVTPGLEDGTILPGITRQTVLDLARDWNEFPVREQTITMADIRHALKNELMLEMFGVGTAGLVCPVDKIVYRKPVPLDDQSGNPTEETLLIMPNRHQQTLSRRIFDTIFGIQHGTIEKPSWTMLL